MTDELVYQIDLAWDKIGFKNLDASINKSIKAFTAVTAVITAANAAIFAMSKKYANSTDELIKTAGRVDATTQSIERLTFAAQDNGAGMDDITGALGSLAKAQEELLRGKGDFEAWGRLGVNPTEYESTSDLLIAISDSVKDLDSTEAIDLMGRVGISPKLLQTMQQGSDGIKDLGDQLESLGGITTEDMKKASQDFQSGWLRAYKTVNGVLKGISATMLDNTINPAIKSFNKFVKENMKQISQVLNAIFESIAKASSFIFGLINRMAQPFIKLNDILGGVENSVKAIGAAMLYLSRNTLIAMAPAIIAVGLLFLAFDDLMSFLSGEGSLLGDFIDNFPVLSTVVGTAIVGLASFKIATIAIAKAQKGAAIAMSIMTTAVKAFNLALKANPIGLAITAIGLLSAGIYAFTTKTEAGKKMFAGLVKWVKDSIKWFKELGKTISDALDFGISKLPSFSDIGDGIGNMAGGLVDDAKSMLGFGASTQAAGQTTSNNNIQITVDGAQSPIAVSEEIKRVLNQELNKSASRIGY